MPRGGVRTLKAFNHILQREYVAIAVRGSEHEIERMTFQDMPDPLKDRVAVTDAMSDPELPSNSRPEPTTKHHQVVHNVLYGARLSADGFAQLLERSAILVTEFLRHGRTARTEDDAT